MNAERNVEAHKTPARLSSSQPLVDESLDSKTHAYIIYIHTSLDTQMH